MLATAMLFSLGCTSTKQLLKPITTATTEVQNAVLPPEPAKPAAFCQCVWANRLQQLPDPVHNGRMTAGVVGQAFIWDAESMPTDADGELTIRVVDATTTPGHVAHTMEVWNFNADTIKQMRVHDDRWGKSHALFLPWPTGWNDVNRLSIQSRFDQPGKPPVYSQETPVTLDLTSGPGATAGGVVPGVSGSQAMVPNPHQARRDAITAPQNTIVPAGGVTPPQPGVMPQQPSEPAKDQRFIIKRQ